MANTDFGHTGAVPGKVDLRCGKEAVCKGIKNKGAVDELVGLTKSCDMWKNPEPEEAKEEEATVVAA